MSQVQVTVEATPNPNSLRFVFSNKFTDQSVDFATVQSTENSPLARKIFGFPWASGVYIGPNFVTVSKQDWVSWEVLAEPLAGLLREHIERGEPVFIEAKKINLSNANEPLETDSALVKNIKHVINAEIRPAVAMDGGDILFHSLADGILKIQMKGACSGCPSSQITLKDGIEVRMKELFTEIKEVQAV